MKRVATLKSEKLQNKSESLIQHYEDGQRMEQSHQQDCHQVIESSIFQGSQKTKRMKNVKRKSSSIQGSQVTNKKTISKDRSNTFKTNSSKQTKNKNSNMFSILHPDSISKEKGLSEFWTQSKMEKYKELSWLQEIDWQGLDSTSSNGYVVNTEQKSWFSMTKIQRQPKNSEKTFCPSSKFIVINGTEVEDTKKPTKLKKTLKLRLFPTKSQKEILNRWAGCARYTYNKTLATIKKPNNTLKNWMHLRNRYVTSKSKNSINSFFNNKRWLLDTPKSVRLSAVQEVTRNLKSCFTNRRNGNIETFVMNFKSKRKEQKDGWSIGIEKNNVVKKGDMLAIFPKYLGNMKYGRKKQLHKLISGSKPCYDPRIQRDKFGDYYLLVVMEVSVKQIPKIHNSVASYDPGSVVYLSGYKPSGEAYLIGKGCDEKLLSLLEELDNLMSLRGKTKGHSQEVVKRKIIRLRKKIHNLKAELHNQVNNIVAKNSSLILYPKLDTQKLTLKERRQLKTKTVRQMLNLGHCTAYEKLKNKCLEHGSHLLTVSEAFTTKTCSCCGKLNNCDNNRIFRCSCGFKAERDINGGLNILLRSID